MSDTHSPDEFEPKTQLETARGGSGRSGKTSVGAGSGGDSEKPGHSADWPDDPDLPHRPRTIICEKDELLRSGLRAMIASFVSIIAEVSNGTEALEMIRRLGPDLVILDVDLDQLNGLEVCRRTCSELPAANCLIYSDYYHATKYHNQILRAGGRGVCLKSSGPRTLFEALEHVTRSLPYYDPKITQLIKPRTNMPSCNLTDREIEVLIRLHLRNGEISEELDMKLRTVEKHIECILAKLKVSTRTAAALKAVQLDLVLLPKMPERDPETDKLIELITAEEYAREAIRRQSARDKRAF